MGTRIKVQSKSSSGKITYCTKSTTDQSIDRTLRTTGKLALEDVPVIMYIPCGIREAVLRRVVQNPVEQRVSVEKRHSRVFSSGFKRFDPRNQQGVEGGDLCLLVGSGGRIHGCWRTVCRWYIEEQKRT